MCLQASATKWIRYALFWEITEHILVIIYWCFGTSCWSHLQGSLEDATNRVSWNVGEELYHYNLHNFLEERRSQNLILFVCIIFKLLDKFKCEICKTMQCCTGMALQCCTGMALQCCAGMALQCCTGMAPGHERHPSTKWTYSIHPVWNSTWKLLPFTVAPFMTLM